MTKYYTHSRLAAAVIRGLEWLYRGRADARGYVYYDKMPSWACSLARRMHQIAWPGVTTY